MSLPTFHHNLLLLKLIPRLGNRKIHEILHGEQSIKEKPLSDSFLLKLRKSTSDLDLDQIRDHALKLNTRIETESIHMVSTIEIEYPEALKRSYEPPPVIFYKGDISYDYSRSIAVVGTRMFTAYGREACINFVRELSLTGFTIISGLASGIDSIAHITGIENKARCIGVIGHGFDYCFPASNKPLYDSVVENGGAIISEFLPDVRPARTTFPVRNKTIASLARVTLVVEAAEKSGSLITARDAFAENRDVFAIPADITRPSYQGCNQLIRSNTAKLVTSPAEILADLGIGSSSSSKMPIASIDFTDVQREFINLVSMERITSDEISNRLAMHITVINEILSELELQGVIIRDDQQRWMIAN